MKSWIWYRMGNGVELVLCTVNVWGDLPG